ncbi:hypothetical protein ACHAWF_009234 [Thalassiosira exigua]
MQSPGLCADEDGEFLTHIGTRRQCRWFNRDGVNENEDADEKLLLNCGITEIGKHCLETCPCDASTGSVILAPAAVPTTVDLVPTTDLCVDGDGEYLTHMGTLRACRWINRDGVDDNESAEEKRLFNCGATELGMNCLGSCPCDAATGAAVPHPTAAPTTAAPGSLCADGDGEYLTHMNTLRACRWFNRDGVEDNESLEEKRLLNCGITEIGLNCLGSCPCDAATGAALPSPTASPTTAAPTPRHATEGVFLAGSQDVLILSALADASVSEAYPGTNLGDSKRLNVAENASGDRRQQSLLLFDLSFVSEMFGTTVGSATLNIYSVTGSGSSAEGVVFKKMEDPSWDEGVTWDSMPGGDGENEPVISFLDGSLKSNSWYEVDVLAAVQDALKAHEPRLGIRILPEGEGIDLYFGSRERAKESPTLVVDSRTRRPTKRPTMKPTNAPTVSPTSLLDCMDKKGSFVNHMGETRPCSWLGEGDSRLRRNFNCQNPEGSAAELCQAQCAAYNGCDSLHCTDKAGTYMSHSGLRASCSWLTTGHGTLKLEQNCGDGNISLATELGVNCQKSCQDYNGCATI